MSGAYGGVVLSDRPAPKCPCGEPLSRGQYYCTACQEWYEQHEARIVPCRWCGHSFFLHRTAEGCCSKQCRVLLSLDKYHSQQEVERFVLGWTIMGLDVLQAVFRELYPPALVMEAEPRPFLAFWNVLYNVPVVSPAIHRGTVPRRPGLVTEAAISSNLVMEYEDENERLWDLQDERK